MSLRFTSLVLIVGLASACGGKAFENDHGTGGSGDLPGVGGTFGTGGTLATGGGGAGGAIGTGGMAAGITSCDLNSDCVVRPASCCGACGGATLDDAAAINRNRLADYDLMVCQGQGCQECYMPNDPTIVATCRSGICSLTFLLDQPLTECVADTDCSLRTRDCCECGGNIDFSNLIALNGSGRAYYAELVCDPNTACQDCLPAQPMNAEAGCYMGRCAVRAIQ